MAGEFRAELFPRTRFDLVIARDLVEHLRDPHQFMKDVGTVLKPGGLFYFITPNGRENLWLINQAFIHEHKETVILINHVHYFLPQVLDRLLSATGFDKEMGFKWGLKGHEKGLGHREFKTVPDQKIPAIDPASPIQLSSRLWKHDTREITRSLLHGLGPVSRLYSIIRDAPRGRCDYYEARGRQFFVIARKVQAGITA